MHMSAWTGERQEKNIVVGVLLPGETTQLYGMLVVAVSPAENRHETGPRVMESAKADSGFSASKCSTHIEGPPAEHRVMAAATKSTCSSLWLVKQISSSAPPVAWPRVSVRGRDFRVGWWPAPNEVNLQISGFPYGRKESTSGLSPPASNLGRVSNSWGISPVFRPEQARRRKSIDVDCWVCARIPLLGIQLAGLLSRQFRQQPRSKLGLWEHKAD